MRAWVLRLSLVISCAVPAAAEAQFTRHPYDITEYDLNIRPDFETREISLHARVHIVHARGSDTFRFGLSPRYRDVAVRVNHERVEIVRTGSVIAVPNAAALDDAILEFDLHGALAQSEDEERQAIDADSVFLLWSDRFYPIDYADWARVKTSILLPDDMLVMAPGVETSATRTAAGTWHVFESRTPAVKFSILADRHWIRRTSRAGGIVITTLLHEEVASLASDLHRTSADIVRFYTQLHGFYPADAFAFVTIKGMFARRAFSGFIGYEPEYLKRMMKADGYDAHETALLWWGYAAHGEGPGAFQWTEGFGDYVEVLYTRARHKPVSANLARARKQYESLAPTADVPVEQLKGSSPEAVVHGKLPWLMDAVRQEIGDVRFRAAIRTLFRECRWRTFTLDEFVDVFERAAPASSRARVRQTFQRRRRDPGSPE